MCLSLRRLGFLPDPMHAIVGSNHESLMQHLCAARATWSRMGRALLIRVARMFLDGSSPLLSAEKVALTSKAKLGCSTAAILARSRQNLALCLDKRPAMLLFLLLADISVSCKRKKCDGNPL